jgi:hypothetical protein
LLQLPRPTIAIEHRVLGAEGIALGVRAVTSAEWGEAEGNPVSISAIALLANGRPAFRSAAEILCLPAPEVDALVSAVGTALARVSPCKGLSNANAWQRVLLDGATHPLNLLACHALGGSFDVIGKFVMDRPDRFFGVPLHALVDAHWFAYHAAKAHVLSLMQ